MRFSRLILLVGFVPIAAAAEAQQPADPPPARRQALEQRVRQRMAAVVQQRLGLTADQMRRLGDVNRDMEAQRRTLHQQEREVRLGLRTEVMRGDSANQERVDRFVDQLIDIQRRRVDLLAREQRALAEFMTPVQRAKYLAMQDQLRRRMEEMRGRPGRGNLRRDTVRRP